MNRIRMAIPITDRLTELLIASKSYKWQKYNGTEWEYYVGAFLYIALLKLHK